MTEKAYPPPDTYPQGTSSSDANLPPYGDTSGFSQQPYPPQPSGQPYPPEPYPSAQQPYPTQQYSQPPAYSADRKCQRCVNSFNSRGP